MTEPPSVMNPILTAEDRSMKIAPGAIIETGYVSINKVEIACRARMSIGDLDRAYQRRLQLGEYQPWPPPRGYWEGESFVVVDGRHDFVAALMLGLEYLFVAWEKKA